MYKGLYIYCSSIDKISLHAWWLFVKDSPDFYVKVSTVVSLLLGTQPKGIGRNFGRSCCNLCEHRSFDNTEHILFECPSLINERDKLWNILMASVPQRMIIEINNMPVKEKCDVLISFVRLKN